MQSMAMQTNIEHKMFFNTLITGEYNMVQGSDSEVTILSSCDGDLYFQIFANISMNIEHASRPKNVISVLG